MTPIGAATGTKPIIVVHEFFANAVVSLCAGGRRGETLSTKQVC